MEPSAGSCIPFTEASLPVTGFGTAFSLDQNGGFFGWREEGKLSRTPFRTRASASLRLLLAVWHARLRLKQSYGEARNNCF